MSEPALPDLPDLSATVPDAANLETLRSGPPALVGTPRGDLAPGTRLDAYTIIDVLGHGGMGVVYRAQQDQPRRVVALKLVRPGVTTAELLARFAFEVQVLGRLQHPGIAQVYEAGTIDAGDGPQPFFAMELVEGRTLTAYIADHRSGIRDRLQLFEGICEAVQHAHGRGVIHRDLKPANILVTHDGQPKILDFGVARVAGGDQPAQTLATTIGQLVGTIPYMSPEQISGDPRELDTRTDVYSLGVVLYEMLAGRLPHDLTHKPLAEAARIIREVDPAHLSTVNQGVSRDLDWIVRRALEKDRGARYQTASDLAADVRRYLADEPIMARAPSAWYVVSKYARRNRALFASAATLILAILAGLGVTSWLLARTLRAERDATNRLNDVLAARAAEKTERERAESEGRRARLEAETTFAVNEFLNNMLASADPAVGDREITVREVLDRAAADAGKTLADRPAIEAAIRTTIGRSYRALARYPQAERELRRAFELRKQTLGEAAAPTLDSMNDVASVLQDQSRLDDALALFRAALPLYERTLGPSAPETLAARNNLGLLLVMLGNYPEAETHFRAALGAQRQNPGNEHIMTLDTISNLATLLQYEGKLDESESLARESLTTRRRVFGDRHPGTLIAINNLGTLLASRSKYAEAEPLYFESLDLSRKVLGEEHADTITSISNCAGLLRDLGRLDEAERMYREALALRERVLGNAHADTIDNRRALGMLLADRGRLDEADPLLTAALADASRSLGADQPDTLACQHALGRLRLRQQRPADAEPLLKDAAARALKTMGPDAWKPAQYAASHAEALTDLRDYSGAEKELRSAYSQLVEKLGPEHGHVLTARAALVRLYEAWGKPDEAARWKSP